MVEFLKEDEKKLETYSIYFEPQFKPLGFPVGMDIELKENLIINIKPEFGYLRRGIEKIVEGMEINRVIPFIDRVDCSSGISTELAFCIGLERNFKINVPIRARFIRTILCELSRISSHLLWSVKLANALGMYNALHYCLREREEVLHLIETVTGSRLTPNFIRIGGVKTDLSDKHIDNLKKFLKSFRRKINSLKIFFLDNELVVNKLNNLGILTKQDAEKLEVTGPNIRALGISKDIRTDDNYEIYDELSFKVPIGNKGDCLDRCMVRIEEIEQSISIISQALYKMPRGEINIYREEINQSSENIFSHVECPHGELSMDISLNEGKITELKIRGPSYNSLFAFTKAAIGEEVENVELILRSFDICVCEVDK